jgi:uncharacterized protein (TIGR03086 family)
MRAEDHTGHDTLTAAVESMDQLTAAEESLNVCRVVLRGLRPQDGTARTPCAKFTVDQLIEHLLGSLVSLGAAAGVQVAVPTEETAELTVTSAARQAIDGWRARGLEGTVSVGPFDLPAAAAAGILPLELLVHAWDLAKATSQPMAASEEVLSGYLLDVAKGLIRPELRDDDRFAAEVPIGSDASNLERLVAFTGRTPTIAPGS